MYYHDVLIFARCGCIIDSRKRRGGRAVRAAGAGVILVNRIGAEHDTKGDDCTSAKPAMIRLRDEEREKRMTNEA